MIVSTASQQGESTTCLSVAGCACPASCRDFPCVCAFPARKTATAPPPAPLAPSPPERIPQHVRPPPPSPLCVQPALALCHSQPPTPQKTCSAAVDHPPARLPPKWFLPSRSRHTLLDPHCLLGSPLTPLRNCPNRPLSGSLPLTHAGQKAVQEVLSHGKLSNPSPALPHPETPASTVAPSSKLSCANPLSWESPSRLRQYQTSPEEHRPLSSLSTSTTAAITTVFGE